MKTSTYLFITLLFALYFPAHAQDSEIDQNDWKEWTRGAKMVRTTAVNESVEGSPYFNSEWTLGRVTLKSDNKTKTIPLRFNCNSNELEFKKDDEILIAIPRMVKAFNIKNEDGEEVLFKNGFKSESEGINRSLFLRIIYEGGVKLVAYHHTNFMKAHSINPLTGKKVSRYIPKKDYFLISEDGKFHDIKLKRKHLLRALNKNEAELKIYAKSNDLDFGNENDLVKILSHYENL